MNIDVGSITGILLADGWHDAWGFSFTVSQRKLYEVRMVGPGPEGETFDLGGDAFAQDWFSMREQPEGIVLAGPLSSVLAVRLKP